MKTLFIVMVAVAAAVGIGIYQRGRISDLEGKITGLETEQRRLERLQPEGRESAPGAVATAGRPPGGAPEELRAAVQASVLQLLDEMGELIRQSEAAGDRQSMEEEGKAIMIKLMTLSGDEALKAIEEVGRRDWPDEMKMGVSMMLMTSVMESDPERAMEIASKFDLPSREGRMMLVMLARQWAAKDPEKAAEYFENLPDGSAMKSLDGQLKQMVEGSIAMGYAKKNLPKAFEYAAGLEDERTRKQVVQALSVEMKTVAQWQHYLEAAKGIDDAKLQSSALLGLASTLSRQPFNQETMDSFDIPDSMKAEFVRKFATSHIDSQTASRADWAMGQAMGEIDRQNLISQLVNRWTWQDFNGAGAWLGSLPESRERDEGVRIFAGLVSRKEPESAIDWALTIKDPKIQEKALNAVYERSEKESPGKVAAYLKELNVEFDFGEAPVVTPESTDP